jgi:phosphoketolase
MKKFFRQFSFPGGVGSHCTPETPGFFATYESFVHVIDSMVNQHAKWLEKCRELSWRAPVPSLNLLITSTVWRQDHNGFTHQDPGFLDIVANKSPEITRIYLPPGCEHFTFGSQSLSSK